MNMSRARLLLATALTAAIGAFVFSSLGCGGEPPDEPPKPAEETARTLGQGSLVGAIGTHGSHAWRGVPYAQPPVGPLRWRAPKPPEPWAGTREALENGDACPQFTSPFGGQNGEEANSPSGSEDCLVLNVFAPPYAPNDVPTGSARLPVMLWIHGGGNTIGSADFYDGGHLATAHDVIVVAVNYRLGAFGWFTHPALRGDDTSADDRSGNYGTLDLVRALEWVRDNAAAFGGDSDNVTVFGESAGGTNVVTMLLSPRARGLFHRAIVQSGSTSSNTIAEAENFSNDTEPGHLASSRETLLSLLVSDGAANRDEARRKLEGMSSDRVAAYLREKTIAEILETYDAGGMGGMYDTPKILRDGHVLPREEFSLVFARADGPAPVPVVFGTNRDEMKLFMLFGSPHIRRVFGIPVWAKDQAAYDLETEYQTNMWRADGANEPASAMRAAGARDVFVYRFDWDEEPKVMTADLSKLLGAAHALEIPFVFGNFDLGPGNRFLWDEDRTAARDALGAAMMSYWTEFAWRGDPGRGRDGSLTLWKRWDDSAPTTPRFIVLDTPEDGGLRMSSASVTTTDLISNIATDDRFPGDSERCALYAGFVQWTDALSKEEYGRVAGGACRAFPLDADLP